MKGMTSLFFGGDTMLGRLVNQIMAHPFLPPLPSPSGDHKGSDDDDVRNYEFARKLMNARGHPLKEGESVGWDYVWGDMLPVMLNADARIVNLETSVTTNWLKYPGKAFNYRMHPGNVEALKRAKIDCVVLANNHIMDFGQTGMLESIETMNKSGIKFAGVGRDKNEASRPAILNINGKNIGVFSFADHGSCEYDEEGKDLWAAAPNKPGFNFENGKNPGWLKPLLDKKAYQPQLDMVIFSIHWGPNYSWHPSKHIRNFAHYLVDECGVDIVHGHSAHHIQGIEIRNGKPIIYGCGDFVDDYAVDEEYRNDHGCGYVVHIDNATNRTTKLELFPTKITAFQVNRARDEHWEWVKNTMKTLCAELGTNVTENRLRGVLEISIP